MGNLGIKFMKDLEECDNCGMPVEVRVMLNGRKIKNKCGCEN